MSSHLRPVTILKFDVGPVACALRPEDVGEVLPLPALDRPPACPEALAGILNLGGTAVPVLRLDRLFGLPASPPAADQVVLLLRDRRPPLAVLADRATGVAAVDPDRLLPVPEGETCNGCVAALVAPGPDADGPAVQLLSAERLVDARERQALADFQAMQQRRLDALQAAAEAQP